MSEQFKLQIGAKRQVTLPVRLLELLALEEGSEIQIYVDKEHATLVPMVSVPRHLVSRALLQEMESRRGLRSSDLTLDEFATQIGVDAKSEARRQEILAALSPRERALLEIIDESRTPATPSVSHNKPAPSTRKKPAIEIEN
jgi:bifunctional DNA-binding transcriptional regulator/antitoxin component of YhaV-PrlF toxin-antitoxin module